MAVIPRAQLVALAVAGVVAAALPALLLSRMPGGARVTMEAADAPPLAPSPLPVLAAIFGRQVFAPADAVADAPPGDAPGLVGIVGRIDRDAMAMVRAADGSTRTLAVGESVDGWRLESLAIDAAFFTRGRERLRVPLPAGDVPPADQ